MNKHHRELCKRTRAKGVEILKIEAFSKNSMVHFKDLLGRDRTCFVSRHLAGTALFNAIADIIRIANDTTPTNQPVFVTSNAIARSIGKSRQRQRQPPKPPRVVKNKPLVLMGVEVQTEPTKPEPTEPEPTIELLDSKRTLQNAAIIKDRMIARMQDFDSRPEPVLTPSEPKSGDVMQSNGFRQHVPIDRLQPTNGDTVKKKVKRKHLLNKDLIRLTKWVIDNWDKFKATQVTMTDAAKMATKDLGCTITGHNIGTVATDLGREWPGAKPKPAPKPPGDPSIKLLLESLCTIADHVRDLTADLGTSNPDLDRAVKSLKDMAKVVA